jgi:hypothetical protein
LHFGSLVTAVASYLDAPRLVVNGWSAWRISIRLAMFLVLPMTSQAPLSVSGSSGMGRSCTKAIALRLIGPRSMS